MESITEFKFFETMRPYISIERHLLKDGSRPDNIQYRIEIRRIPEELALEAMAFTIPCAFCGELMHPFRARISRNLRAGKTRSDIYFAATCPLRVNVRCSRSDEAGYEYERVYRAIKGEE